jgi:hypothetical protein
VNFVTAPTYMSVYITLFFLAQQNRFLLDTACITCMENNSENGEVMTHITITVKDTSCRLNQFKNEH